MADKQNYVPVQTITKLQAVWVQETLVSAGIPAILSYDNGRLSPTGDYLMVMVPSDYTQETLALLNR